LYLLTFDCAQWAFVGTFVGHDERVKFRALWFMQQKDSEAARTSVTDFSMSAAENVLQTVTDRSI